MIKIVKPKYDATIYEFDSDVNTGHDSILELSYNETYGLPSRILMKVDIDDLPNADSYYLKLYTVQTNEIPLDYTIISYPISQHWDTGYGKLDNSPQTKDNVTWTNATTLETWSSGSGSMDSNIVSGGGTWNSLYSTSQDFSFSNTDIELDITEFVNLWKNNTIDNHGIIIKMKDETVNFGNLQFYAYDTHTVFQPKIYCYYNSGSFFNTKLLEPIFEYQHGTVVHFTNLNSFKQNTTVRIRLTGRERFPKKTYSLVSDYLKDKFLPDTTYYSIKDAHSEHTIVDFNDNYTKVSCDVISNYFDLNLNDFDPERVYKILIKIVWYNDIEEIYDNDYLFRVTR